jgi:transcriptional regulator with XRE-family HTH domain
MDYEKYIAERVIQLRLEKGVSANDMSISIGQNRNYINRIENRRHIPSIHGLYYICEYFRISLAEFFSEEAPQSMLISETIGLIKELDAKNVAFINYIIKNFGHSKIKGA